MARQRETPTSQPNRKRRASAMDTSNTIRRTLKGPSIVVRRANKQGNRNQAFEGKLRQLAMPLVPLVQLPHGHIHPAFPRSILQYHLLTNDQLESLAHFYHQRSPSRWTLQYPCPVSWRSDLSMLDKRRKLGKFIGLRGCETPVSSSVQISPEDFQKMIEEVDRQWERDTDGDGDEKTLCGSQASNETVVEGELEDTCKHNERQEDVERRVMQILRTMAEDDVEAAARQNRVKDSEEEALKIKMGRL